MLISSSLRLSTTQGTQMAFASTWENPASRWFSKHLGPFSTNNNDRPFFSSIWRLMKFRILPWGLIMKSKLAQFPRRWLKPIVGPFWGARVSLLSSSASHWDIFISTYIWHNLPTTNSMAVIFMVYRQKNYFFFFNWAITDMAKSTLRLKKIVNFFIFCLHLSYDELSFSPTQL